MLRTAATDGARLARCEGQAPEGADGMPGIIIPRKSVKEIIKMALASDVVSVSLSDSKLKCETAKAILTTKLIDGTYPDYARVIPSGNDKFVQVDKQTLLAAVDRVSTIQSEKSRGMKLIFGDGELKLSVKNDDGGTADEDVAVEGAHELSIGFNSKFLTDVLANINGPTVQIALADSGSPTIFTSPSDEDALFLLMSMRV
jgi:DNA polymerase-3 subunit beta